MSGPHPWWGTLHLRPASGASDAFDGAVGAYANVVALATDQAGYRAAVEREMAVLGLVVVEVEKSEPLSADESDSELADLRDELTAATPVRYQTFDTYKFDDA
ncbi:hypothetical protein [Brevundimonas sp. R86498]|uniref:hypothetical protein n=1 Tax=Brevundimonas sp. R86498 TaxID=3093845 RepID=UPI0037CBA149